jgi:hypothetical protein
MVLGLFKAVLWHPFVLFFYTPRIFSGSGGAFVFLGVQSGTHIGIFSAGYKTIIKPHQCFFRLVVKLKPNQYFFGWL